MLKYEIILWKNDGVLAILPKCGVPFIKRLRDYLLFYLWSPKLFNEVKISLGIGFVSKKCKMNPLTIAEFHKDTRGNSLCGE